jgi:hypothetical protein
MKIFKALLPMIIVLTVVMVYLYVVSMDVPWWLSVVFHFFGGLTTAWSALMVYNFYQKKFKLKIRPQFLFYLFLISLVALAGILWEVYEYIHDCFSSVVFQPSLADTMSDLAADLLGAIVFVGILVFRRQR